MENRTIQQRIFELRDERYAAFQMPLIPTVAEERFVGVRTPDLRRLAKELTKSGEATEFIATLPHETFDEDQLHAFILSEMKDFDACLTEVERFLPHVDNWATCDQLSPRVFGKHHAQLQPHVRRWMKQRHEYSVRFGIGMLMQHFLDEDFRPRYLELVAAVRREEYYIRMMQAWYFATALAKQYEATLPYLEERRLAPWTHNKTIQKAIESYRITPEQKAYLRSLRISTRK